VVVGGHRDAWTYGAVDPISGTVDLLQLGEALGKAARAGWKPRRSIVIGSWDGEELNLFGSETWVEQHEDELRRGCVAYMNTDEVAFGPELYVAGTPDLLEGSGSEADGVRGGRRERSRAVCVPREPAGRWGRVRRAVRDVPLGV
jgi:Zn-dependent M28 family amino/carboxypeptidase